MGVLYLVPTPIGNLEDVTLRALRVLREVSLIAAEDTRTARKLLNHYDIKTKFTSYHDHNRKAKIPFLLETLKTTDVALVSEAGMPAISDPGHELVVEAAKGGVPVVPLAGASALTAALAVSGLPVEGSLFLGFLPRRKGERRKLLESVRELPHTIVAFESPHRLHASLEDALAVLGDRRIAVCRELTKLYEEVFRGTLSQALDHFDSPRGEFTLVVAGATDAKLSGDRDRDLAWARDELRRLKGQGVRAKEAVATVAGASSLPRRDVYALWLEIGSP